MGDRVECYQHASNAVLQHPDAIRAWPSRFTCEDLSCNKEESACSKKSSETSAGTEGGGTDPQEHPPPHEHSEDCMQLDPPKVYNLDDLDLTGDEWNVDFGNDSSLLGLFKLSTPGGAV